MPVCNRLVVHVGRSFEIKGPRIEIAAPRFHQRAFHVVI